MNPPESPQQSGESSPMLREPGEPGFATRGFILIERGQLG